MKIIFFLNNFVLFLTNEKKYFGVIFIIFSFTIFSQEKDTLQLKNGIDKPSILPIHHFGMFSARINQNFKTFFGCNLKC